MSTDNLFSRKRYFWVNGTGSETEVDFVIQFDGKVIPIEVKTGYNSRLRSLHQFMEKYRTTWQYDSGEIHFN